MEAISPMLAQLARELPRGDHLYEPKWDGFRCLGFVDDGEVDLRSRNGRPFARYFPEVVEAIAPLRDAILDGELLASDFGALLNCIHPSRSRIDRLRRETPATFVVFDLLRLRGEDLTGRPFAERRARLESLDLVPPLAITPITGDPDVARAWLREGTHIDGIVAKRRDSPYQPGKRGWIKVKPERTADCVVGGLRILPAGAGLASLLLGLYEGDLLVHVGVSSSFPAGRRRELLRHLMPLIVELRGHPWERGFNLGRHPVGRLPGSAGRWVAGEMTLDWIPLAPERVCEVAYDKLDGVRFRHPARFLRWRPDRGAESCLLGQLRAEEPRQGALSDRRLHEG